jgi:hypothetical protein
MRPVQWSERPKSSAIWPGAECALTRVIPPDCSTTLSAEDTTAHWASVFASVTAPGGGGAGHVMS